MNHVKHVLLASCHQFDSFFFFLCSMSFNYIENLLALPCINAKVQKQSTNHRNNMKIEINDSKIEKDLQNVCNWRCWSNWCRTDGRVQANSELSTMKHTHSLISSKILDWKDFQDYKHIDHQLSCVLTNIHFEIQAWNQYKENSKIQHKLITFLARDIIKHKQDSDSIEKRQTVDTAMNLHLWQWAWLTFEATSRTIFKVLSLKSWCTLPYSASAITSMTHHHSLPLQLLVLNSQNSLSLLDHGKS